MPFWKYEVVSSYSPQKEEVSRTRRIWKYAADIGTGELRLKSQWGSGKEQGHWHLHKELWRATMADFEFTVTFGFVLFTLYSLPALLFAAS